jgi:hypothetical protein
LSSPVQDRRLESPTVTIRYRIFPVTPLFHVALNGGEYHTKIKLAAYLI